MSEKWIAFTAKKKSHEKSNFHLKYMEHCFFLLEIASLMTERWRNANLSHQATLFTSQINFLLRHLGMSAV